MRARSRLALAAAAGLSLAATTGAGAASAAPASAPHRLHVITTLADSYVGPLQFAIHGKKVLVADSFTATLNQIGRSAPLASGPKGGDVAGVDSTSDAYAYTSSTDDHSVATLTIVRKHHRTVVADLAGYEKKHNPDGTVHYGAVDPSAVSQACSDQLGALQIPVDYLGQVDSHPYAVTSIGHGAWAVADAGGNDLLRVNSKGHVSLISVLPAQTITITQAAAASNGIPDCAGLRARFESVPTDVELGPHGRPYVSLLPGGVEGPDNGNPGSVYRISASGHASRVATGFASATNLAIDPHGRIYVAELGSGAISVVRNGRPYQVAALPGVAAVEWFHGHLYASTAPAASGAQGPGSVVELG